MSADKTASKLDYLDDAVRWRERAEEVRVVSESMANAHCKTTLLGVAHCCALEAMRAERRLKERRYASGLPNMATPE